MTKCKDGRKHVIVGKYTKKDGIEISRYERSCPSIKGSETSFYCCVCGEEYDEDKLHAFDIKGETKKICEECADTIHGLL